MNLRSPRNAGPRSAIIYYKVEDGDTIESMAEKFDISTESIIWANEVPPEEITLNSVIRIPPVTGVIHVVQREETVESIAERYGVNPEAITNYPYNEFSNDPAFPLYGGQMLIVPGGRK
jgi:LysM repeat protein